jgi:hypothetical protein
MHFVVLNHSTGWTSHHSCGPAKRKRRAGSPVFFRRQRITLQVGHHFRIETVGLAERSEARRTPERDVIIAVRLLLIRVYPR